MNHLFNAFTNNVFTGQGAAGELQKWLEKMVNILFPQNGIEYWSDNRGRERPHLKPFQELPRAGRGSEDVDHAVGYVRLGRSEGRMIEVGLMLNGGVFQSLAWAKSFGPEDECWQIARACTKALEHIFLFEEVPAIVQLSEKLPRRYAGSREVAVAGKVTIAVEPSAFTVTAANGLALDRQDFPGNREVAAHHINAYVKDWCTVLANLNVEHEVIQDVRLVVPDLPGYLFTSRGAGENAGFYVLPPGGDKNIDPQYLGFYLNADMAIAAARKHRDSTVSTSGTQLSIQDVG